jgi:hypothetical protein
MAEYTIRPWPGNAGVGLSGSLSLMSAAWILFTALGLLLIQF